MLLAVTQKQPRPRTHNPKLERLMRASLSAAGISIGEFGERSRFGRQVAGRIVRGEVQTVAPDQANVIVRVLPITMEQLLEAVGYEIAITPQRRVPQALADAWAECPPDVREGLLQLAQAGARLANPVTGSAA
jgi:hypothetical protein